MGGDGSGGEEDEAGRTACMESRAAMRGFQIGLCNMGMAGAFGAAGMEEECGRCLKNWTSAIGTAGVAAEGVRWSQTWASAMRRAATEIRTWTRTRP